jgi:hypothetical protein
MRQISNKITDLQDADTPESVAIILRNAASRYRESVPELQAAWGDVDAGKIWDKIAKCLETAANRCDKITSNY